MGDRGPLNVHTLRVICVAEWARSVLTLPGDIRTNDAFPRYVKGAIGVAPEQRVPLDFPGGHSLPKSRARRTRVFYNWLSHADDPPSPRCLAPLIWTSLPSCVTPLHLVNLVSSVVLRALLHRITLVFLYSYRGDRDGSVGSSRWFHSCRVALCYFCSLENFSCDSAFDVFQIAFLISRT